MSASAMREQTTPAAPAAWGRAIAAGIHAAKCEWVVYVPDNPLSHVLQALAEDHPGIRTVLATREEEAFGIAAGLYLGGCRSAVMLQSSGLGNSLNALGSLLIPYQIPVLAVISMRGGPGEWNQAQTPIGHAVPRFLDALGIQHTRAEALEGAEGAMRLAASLAFDTRVPAACLLVRSLTTGSQANRRSDGSGNPLPSRDARDAESAARSEDRSAPAAKQLDGFAMNRLEATRVVTARARADAIVAALGHPAYDLFVADDRPENFYTWGSMGLASSIGLGLALARPDRRVIVLDGDGSLLMNLGSLATIGVYRPSNLLLIVWDNGEYGTTGGQKAATAFGADLAAAGRALGISRAVNVGTRGELENAVDSSSDDAGPGMIVARVSESAPTAKPPFDCVYLKHRFMAAFGTAEAATGGGPA
jgi:sulfopyruvate decarboxylase alpha subunit